MGQYDLNIDITFCEQDEDNFVRNLVSVYAKFGHINVRLFKVHKYLAQDTILGKDLISNWIFKSIDDYANKN